MYNFVPPDDKVTPEYLRGELQRLQEALEGQMELLRLGETNVAPDKPREGDIRYSDGTNWDLGCGSGPYYFDGTDWIPLGRQLTYTTPASIEVIAGGTPVGDVTDMQTYGDGNAYNLPEVASDPGFDLRITFTGITSIRYISSATKYDGQSAHQVELQIYNATGDTWTTLTQIPAGEVFNTRFTGFPVDDSDYIDSGTAILRILHIGNRNAADDLYVDYLALAS